MHDSTRPGQRLDLSGLHCPVPLIRCLASLERLPVGAGLRVTVSNRDALNDLALLLRRGPHRLVGWRQGRDGRCHFHIRKRGPTPPRPQARVSLLHWLLRHLGVPWPTAARVIPLPKPAGF
ncbi:MAG: sulfurtransferase TusA family protein [Gammaproteobacteria bacterium]